MSYFVTLRSNHVCSIYKFHLVIKTILRNHFSCIRFRWCWFWQSTIYLTDIRSGIVLKWPGLFTLGWMCNEPGRCGGEWHHHGASMTLMYLHRPWSRGLKHWYLSLGILLSEQRKMVRNGRHYITATFHSSPFFPGRLSWDSFSLSLRFKGNIPPLFL